MDKKVEFERKERVGCGYVLVPQEIIENSSLGKLRVSVFSVLGMKRSIDGEIHAPTRYIVNWLNKKESRSKNGINENIDGVIQQFKDYGYISDAEDNYGLKIPVYSYNTDHIVDLCRKGNYALLYCDEIKKIINYYSDTFQSKRYNLDVALIVFAYLRMKMPRRKNEIYSTELNEDNNGELYRKSAYPEAWYSHFNEIAADIGLTCETVSNAIKLLVELDLIVCEEAIIGKKKTDQFAMKCKIFANTYKREGDYLLASGKEYFENEILNLTRKYNLIR